MLLVLRESDVEDTHLAFIREMWAGVNDRSVNDRSADSTLAIVQRILAKQVEWSREPIEVPAIAPEVASFLTKIRERGLRATLELYVG